ncbi:MAG: outer membrane beta-barrel protein [Bacteroidetes bacterium]|jgi:outer membrane protein W|nr:outer membrane beta-barrel protein [Bacteroidota bacterium]
MKKLLLLPVLFAFALMANAQSTNYHAFKFDIQLGYADPSGSSGSGGTKAGVTVTLQPHYRVSDDFALGLRLEAAAIGYVNKAVSSDTKVYLLTSYFLTAEYYFTDSGFRPFIGAGTGLVYQRSAQAGSGYSGLVSGGSRVGAFPELGFEAGHFRLSADYDAMGKGANYFAFKIGAFFGGGSKKK